MPAKKQITKEAIIKAAFELVRKNGIGEPNARNIAKALNCSTQPIYLSFKSMSDLKSELYQKAEDTYQSYIKNEIENSSEPPYKASGLAYVRFAKNEKQLFKFLFMRERTKEQTVDEKKYLTGLVNTVSKKTGLDKEKAFKFHSEMWFFTHGIATMLATSYFDLDMDTVSDMLTDVYEGLKLKYSVK